MNAVVNPCLDRIVVNPSVRSPEPCARHTRTAVQEILSWLASGATEDEIRQDYPYLPKDYFKAVFANAARFPNPRTASL
jgi:uncharacterized protein (DUF433 family)